MNLLTLRARARRLCGISNTTELTSAVLDEDLNASYNQICAKIASINEDYFEEQKAKFNLVANSGLYALPTDCLKITGLRLAYTTPSDEGDYAVAKEYDPALIENAESEEISSSTSEPIFDVTNSFYRIWPKPDTAVTSGGELYYIARPSALTLTADSPIVPQDYHDILAVFAAKEAAFRFGFYDKADRLKLEYEGRLKDMLSELEPRVQDSQPRMINPLETDRVSKVRELE